MTTKDLNYYMSLPYTIEFTPNDDGIGFSTAIPRLKGCLSFGDTLQEAYEMIIEAKQLWIEATLEKEWDVPEPVA